MKSLAHRVLVLFTLGASAASVGCTPDEATLIVTMVDRSTNTPIPNGLLAVETGGVYQPTPDPAKANPSWVHGAQANSEGAAELLVAGGQWGFHTFAEGYFYGSAQRKVNSDPYELTIMMSQLSGDEVPVSTDFKVEPSTVAPGGEFVASVEVTAPADDPLSEEVAITIPDMFMSVLMDPPSAGTPGVGYPDGLYTRTLTAPDTPGTYKVWLAVTTEHCVTAPPIAIDLIVE